MAEDVDARKLPLAIQFPSKFAALPDISSFTNNDSNMENRLMPYQNYGRDRLEAVFDDRMRALETKINVTEKSNRLLLEEVVRLQSELKTANRRAEDALRNERNARITQENSIQGSNDLISHLTLRLKRCEDRINDDLSLVADLVNQSKSLEQSLVANRYDFTNKRDLQSVKFEELKRDIVESNRGKDQLERFSQQLKDEIRLLKIKFDTETSEIVQAVKELRGRSKKLEDENRQTSNNIRIFDQDRNQVEMTTVQLRQQVETRLSELRDVILDIRSRQDQEIKDRRNLEQQTQLRLHDLQNNLSEQVRQKDEAIHKLDTMIREKDHGSETERIRMQSRSIELVEDMGKKILKKELKLREDTQERFIQLEKLVEAEKHERLEAGRNLEGALDQVIEGIRKKQVDDSALLRELMKTDKSKSSDAVAKLDAAITILDEQIASGQRQIDKLLAAEIKSRKQHERDTRERVDQLQDKIGVATATLQEAIGGIDTQVAILTEQVRRDLSSKLDERHSTSLRHVNDLDARLLSLTAKLAQLENNFDGRLSATSNDLSENVKGKVQDLSTRLDVLSRAVDEIKKLSDSVPKEVAEVGEKLAIVREDFDTRMKAEIDSRVSDIEEVRRELMKLNLTDSVATMKDLDKCQASIRRLGETIQTVKTVLGMKMQHEEQTREENVDKIHVELDALHRLVDPTWRGTPDWMGEGTPQPDPGESAEVDDDEPKRDSVDKGAGTGEDEPNEEDEPYEEEDNPDNLEDEPDKKNDKTDDEEGSNEKDPDKKESRDSQKSSQKDSKPKESKDDLEAI